MEIFGVSLPGLLSQLLLGLVNGSFYAILSLGLAVIFGLLNVINFAHGALFMLGALLTWMAMTYLGVNYWVMLIAAPVVVGILGVLIERLLLRWIYKLDHLYGLLLTLGLTLLIEGVFRSIYGVSGLGYDTPELLEGATNLGFMILPNYRAWVVVASIVVCLGTWYVIEKTKLGAYLRAGTENPRLVEAFGVNVPVMITLTYAFGAALAAFAGVLAAPVYQVTPLMGQNLIIVVFAVVVMLFGRVLRLPTWLQDVSPFRHLALVPAEDFRWAPFLALAAVAALLSAAGQLLFRRRDVEVR